MPNTSDIHPQLHKEDLPKVREFDGHDWPSTKVYRRNLPHWELQGSTYFITVRVDSEIGNPFQDPNLAMFMASCLQQHHEQLKRTGAFWQKENFDHLIRDGIGLREKWEYIRENPVTANLVDKAENYRFSSF